MQQGDKKPAEIAGQNINKTYEVKGDEIYTAQLLYPISEVDFIHLQNQHGWSSRFASVFIGCVVTSGVLVVAKTVDAWTKTAPAVRNVVEAFWSVSGWEVWAFVISICLLVVNFFIGWLLPTKGSELLKTMDKHFEKTK
jgi:hypothetical protein